MTAFVRIQRPRCWPCMTDGCYDELTPHTWMDDEDAAAAGVAWPLSDEDKAKHPCACRCAGGPGGCEVITAQPSDESSHGGRVGSGHHRTAGGGGVNLDDIKKRARTCEGARDGDMYAWAAAAIASAADVPLLVQEIERLKSENLHHSSEAAGLRHEMEMLHEALRHERREHVETAETLTALAAEHREWGAC